MKKQSVAVMAFTTFLTLQSCVKNTTTPENNHPVMVQELKVPADFNWITSKTVTCKVTSTIPAQMAIYADKECAEELLAIFSAGESNTIPLSVPMATTTLYLKYKSALGPDKISEQNIINNIVTFNIADASAAKALNGTKATGIVTKDAPRDEKTHGLISYPAGWGTVLFEDLFPGIGDYDFNDFVASYLIVLENPWKNRTYDTEYATQIRVQLRLRAIGGSLAYTPYVRIMGLNKDLVSLPNPPYGDPLYVNPKIVNNTTDGVEVSLVNSNITNDVIVEFKDLNTSNPFKIQGAAFYNTTPGSIIKYSRLTEVDVYLKLSREVKVANLLDEKIDIFLASADKTKEIHLRGFHPVFSNYNFNAEGVDKTTPYASKENLVWGIKIPKGQTFLHGAEKINFCDAYKDFAAWVTSGGIANQNWYQTNLASQHLIQWPK